MRSSPQGLTKNQRWRSQKVSNREIQGEKTKITNDLWRKKIQLKPRAQADKLTRKILKLKEEMMSFEAFEIL